MRRSVRALAIALPALLLAACGTTPEQPVEDLASIPDAVPQPEPRSRYGNPASYVVYDQRYYVMDSGVDFVQRGMASWYGKKFHGRRTSSGEPYDMYAMTAAHKRLPLPSYVEVTNLDNGRSVVVRVNDRGPFVDDRIIDVSYAAAVKLGMIKTGTAPVEIRVLTPWKDDGTVVEADVVEPVATIASAEPVAATPVHYYVQVGAFRDPANAYRLQGRLLGADLDASVRVEKTMEGEFPLYRVRLGPLSDPAATDRLIGTLTGHGIANILVVAVD